MRRGFLNRFRFRRHRRVGCGGRVRSRSQGRCRSRCRDVSGSLHGNHPAFFHRRDGSFTVNTFAADPEMDTAEIQPAGTLGTFQPDHGIILA